MGAANGLKGLNSGWQVSATCLLPPPFRSSTRHAQVWANGTPTSKRNASISSAASVADVPSDGSYRANLAEGWSTGRSTSATWEEVNGSPQKKDLSQLVSAVVIRSIAFTVAYTTLSHPHARQRTVSAGFPPPRMVSEILSLQARAHDIILDL